jgi:hypothetical protein
MRSDLAAIQARVDAHADTVDDVRALVAELRAAREAIFRLRDAVEILRHHGTPYRWHDAAWNQGLIVADTASAAYDKVTGEAANG